MSRSLSSRHSRTLAAFALITALLGLAALSRAHCDTMDGPVVKDARAALAKRDVTPVLKWITEEHEAAIRTAFQKTLTVREKGPEARELADLYFFETLVRLHRMEEGAPYTGLKPAGTDPGPAVRAADEALAAGSADRLVKLITAEVERGIRHRFEQAHQASAHAGHAVSAGRSYVRAYVEFTHYVERLYHDAVSSAAHDGHSAPADAHGAGHAAESAHEEH